MTMDDLTTTRGNGSTLAPAVPLDAVLLERLVIGGDLGALTPAQRLAYYRHRCEAIGLDPGARPFQYLALQGKLTLYADKGCAQQLASQRGLSFVVTARERLEGDVYEIRGRITGPEGRITEDVGAVFVGGLRGEALANATMKAHTKAYRRTVLAHCGLGMLDESEVDSIRDAVRVNADSAHSATVALPMASTVPALAGARVVEATAESAPSPMPTDGGPPDATPRHDAASPAPEGARSATAKAVFARMGAMGWTADEQKEFCERTTERASRKDCTVDDWRKVHRALDDLERIPQAERAQADLEPGSDG
jgi:hypothetical protein